MDASQISNSFVARLVRQLPLFVGLALVYTQGYATICQITTLSRAAIYYVHVIIVDKRYYYQYWLILHASSSYLLA